MTQKTRLVALAVIVLALSGMAAPERETVPAPPRAMGSQEADVVRVGVNQVTGQPAVVLEGKRDRRRVTLAIGLAEATGIAVPLQGVTPPRPLTHDLFLTLFAQFNVKLTRVVVTDLRDDIYYATVYLTAANGSELSLDARPSDAIALALRAKVPVLIEDRVFDKSDQVGQPARGRDTI
jgi:bifunctional DNase/RNase